MGGDAPRYLISTQLLTFQSTCCRLGDARRQRHGRRLELGRRHGARLGGRRDGLGGASSPDFVIDESQLRALAWAKQCDVIFIFTPPHGHAFAKCRYGVSGVSL